MAQSVNAETVHRVWGYYTVLTQADGYKVKQLTVLPGKSTSLQFHNHRSEHWFVVRGTAEVTHNDQQYILHPQQFAQIATGDLHCLKNAGTTPLILVEVQCGDYVEEDDIVRLGSTAATFYPQSGARMLRLNE